MVVLWILGILAALIVLLLLLRIGVRISFGEELRVTAMAGPVKLQLLPKQEGKEKKPKKERPQKPKKEKKKPSEGEQTGKKKSLGLTFEDITGAIPAVWNAIKGALHHTRMRLKIDPMQLRITFGGEPDQVAKLYGWGCSAMWTVLPTLERLTRMPDPEVHLRMDYDAPKTKVEGEVGLSFQIRDLFRIGFAAAWPVLKWGIVFLKAKKKRDKAAAIAAATEQAAKASAQSAEQNDKNSKIA